MKFSMPPPCQIMVPGPWLKIGIAFSNPRARLGSSLSDEAVGGVFGPARCSSSEPCYGVQVGVQEVLSHFGTSGFMLPHTAGIEYLYSRLF